MQKESPLMPLKKRRTARCRTTQKRTTMNKICLNGYHCRVIQQANGTEKPNGLALPRRARIAIRRLHRNFRHLPRNALLQMLRAARVPKEYIDAAKVHKCDVCTATKPPAPLKKVSPPKPYTFNHEVGVDVFEIKDTAGTFYDILNIVDYGTTMQQAGIVRVGENNGVPSSSSCLEYFHKGWVRCYGWPRVCRS